MSLVFDKGNANLNNFVKELISVKRNDHVLEIGFGTGKLMYEMAETIETGHIEGIDFSETMFEAAKKKNKKHISSGKVKLTLGDFDKTPFKVNSFNKVGSVNTIYFWPNPEGTLKKIAEILKPDGMILLAFEDIDQLKERSLDPDVFNLYSKEEVENLLINTGLFINAVTQSRTRGSTVIHCTSAKKVS